MMLGYYVLACKFCHKRLWTSYNEICQTSYEMSNFFDNYCTGSNSCAYDFVVTQYAKEKFMYLIEFSVCYYLFSFLIFVVASIIFLSIFLYQKMLLSHFLFKYLGFYEEFGI